MKAHPEVDPRFLTSAWSALVISILQCVPAAAQVVPVVELRYKPTPRGAVEVMLDGNWRQPCARVIAEGGQASLLREVIRSWPTTFVALAWGGSNGGLPQTLPARDHWGRVVGGLSVVALADYLSSVPDSWEDELNMANALRIVGELGLPLVGVSDHTSATSVLVKHEAKATMARLMDEPPAVKGLPLRGTPLYRDVPEWSVLWLRVRPQAPDFWAGLLASRRRVFTARLREEWLAAAGSLPVSSFELAQWWLDVPEVVPYEAARLFGLWTIQ